MAVNDEFSDLDFDTETDNFGFDEGSESEGDRDPKPFSPSNMLKSIIDKDNLHVVKRALLSTDITRGYDAALDDLDSAIYEGRTLYDSTKKAAEQGVTVIKNTLKGASGSVAKYAGDYLPDWVVNKLEAFSKKAPVDEQSIESYDPIDIAIKGATLDVFGRYTQAAEDNIATVSDNIGQLSSSIKTTGDLAAVALSKISGDTASLAAFNDNVVLSYYKKSLELQVRSFFVTKELLDVAKASSITMTTKLTGIQKNTGLPDFVKKNLSENMSEAMYSRVFGDITDRFSRSFSPGENIKKAISNLVSNTTSNLFDGIGMLDGIMDDITPGNVRDRIVSSVVHGASKKFMEKVVAPQIKKRADSGGKGASTFIDMNERLSYLSKTLGANLDDIMAGRAKSLPIDKDSVKNIIPESVTKKLGIVRSKAIGSMDGKEVYITRKELISGKLTDVKTNKKIKKASDITGPVVDETGEYLINKAQYAAGIKGVDDEMEDLGDDGIVDILQEYYTGGRHHYNKPESLMQVANSGAEFDNLTRRSIVEVIPGFLSRILEQVTNFATGEKSDRVVYDTASESFKTNAEAVSQLDSSVFNNNSIKYRRDDVSKMVDKIDKNKDLTDDERSAFIDLIIDDIEDNATTWNMARYNDSSNIRTDNVEIGESLAKKLKSIKLSGKEENDLNTDFTGLSKLDYNLATRISKAVASGDTEKLVSAGILINTPNGLTVNTKYIKKRLRGVDDITRPSSDGGVPPVDDAPTGDVFDNPPIAPTGEMYDRVTSAPIGEMINKVTSAPIGEMYNKVTTAPIGDMIDRTVSAPIGEMYNKVRNAPIGEMINKVTSAPIGEMYNKVRNAPIGEMIDKVTTAPIGEMIDKVRNAPIGEMINKVTSAPIGDMINKVTSAPIGDMIDRTVSAPISEMYRNYQGMASDEIHNYMKKAITGGSDLVSVAKQLIESVPGASTILKPVTGYYKLLSKVTNIGGSLAGRLSNAILPKPLANVLPGGVTRLLGEDSNKALYLPGTNLPAITVSDMEVGRFVDSTTGNKIYKPDDITGDVLDSNGELYLTAEKADGLVDRLGDKVTSIGRSVFGKTARKLKSVLKPLSGVGLVGAKTLVKGIGNLFPKKDIYKVGEREPRIYSTAMENGEYISAETGKPIYDIREISGDVLDVDGNVVLSVKDAVKGLCDRSGEPIVLDNIKRLTAPGRILSALPNQLALGFDKITDHAMGDAVGEQPADTDIEPVKNTKPGDVVKLLGNGNVASERVVENVDVAVLGGLKQIQKSLLSVAAEEEEEDKEEEQKEKEKSKGLVDADNDGREDDQLGDMDADGLRDNSWQAIALRKKKEKEAAAVSKTDKTKEKEPEKKPESIVSLLPLVGGLTDKISQTWDSFKGGWETVSGIWDTLKDIGAAIAAYFAWKKTDDIADDVLGEGDIDIDAEGDDDNRRRRRRRGGRGGRGGGKKGWIRGAIDKAKSVLGKGTPSPAGGAARTGVRAAIGRGAAAVGQVAARALPLAGAAVSGTAAALGTSALVAGATLAAGVVAVGAIGYGGYKLYKHLSHNAELEPLEGLRYLQYGIDINNKDAIPAIRKLEEAVIDEMTGSGVSAAPGNDPAYYFNEHAEDFNRSVDSQEDGEQWGYWFAKRFCPILFTHIRNLHLVDDGADIDDVDDDLDPAEKVIFIKKVLFSEKDAANGINPYAHTVSPFPNIPLINDKNIINAYAKKLLDGYVGKIDLDDVKPTDILKKAGESLKSNSGDKTEGGSVYKSTVSAVPQKNKPSVYGMLLNPVTALQYAAPTVDTGLGFFDYVFSPLDSIKTITTVNSLAQQYRNKVLPLEGLRYLQYGSSLEDHEFLAKLHVLEETVLEYVVFSGSVPSITKDYKYFFDEMYKLFGMSDSAQDQLEWCGWFVKRFLPIFIKHVGMLKTLDKEVELLDIDDDLADDLKKDYVGLVAIHPASKEFDVHPYLVAYRPLFGHGIITDHGIIDAYVRLLLKALTVTKDLDAFDPKMLPQEIEKDPSITMKVYRAREDVNGLQSLRERAEKNVAKTDTTVGQGTSGSGGMPPGVKPLTPEQLQGAFISPVANGVVTSKFGQRLHPIKKVMAPHNGLDFAGKTGDPIYAIQDGMVFKQERSPSYGNIVYIKHPNNTTSRYAHLHKFPAGQTVGTEVSKGQIIGFMGSTGRSTGPHLHFEMRDGVAQDARPIDPLKKIDPSTLAGGRSVAKPEPKEDKTYVDGPPIEVASGGAPSPATPIPKLSDDSSIKPAMSVEEVDKTVQSMVNTSAKPPEPTVVQVNGGKDEKILSDILKTQDEGTAVAAEQRNKQLEAQEALLKKMDTLIGVISASEKPQIAAAVPPAPKKDMTVAAAPTFPKTKTTNPVMDYGH